MAKETIEEFLARGGEIQKEQNETTLDKLLYNEGLLNHEDAQKIKSKLHNLIDNALKSKEN